MLFSHGRPFYSPNNEEEENKDKDGARHPLNAAAAALVTVPSTEAVPALLVLELALSALALVVELILCPP
jgi:hypothetical protein